MSVECSHHSAKLSEFPAIDLVSENWESLDIELRAVCDWPLLNKRFFETVGRTTCCSCENESRHEFRLGVEGSCGGKGVEACGRANGGATIRRGVGGVLGREGTSFLSLRDDNGAGVLLLSMR